MNTVDSVKFKICELELEVRVLIPFMGLPFSRALLTNDGTILLVFVFLQFILYDIKTYIMIILLHAGRSRKQEIFCGSFYHSLVVGYSTN